MKQQSPILIIGAGLSGLTLARLLSSHNIPVIVFEQSSPDRSQGYGITARDWAYQPLLEELGGGYTVQDFKRAVATDRDVGGVGYLDLTFRNNGTGEMLFNPDPGLAEQGGVFRANRSVLRNWLAEGVDIRYDHKLVSIGGQPGAVKVAFENGGTAEGSVIVAADGVHSTVRTLLLPQIQQPQIEPVILFHGKRYLTAPEWESFKPLLWPSNIAAGVGDSFNTFVTVANATSAGVHLDWSYSRAQSGPADPLWMPDRGEIIKAPQHLLKEVRSRDLVPPFSTLVNADDIKKDKVYNWRIRSVHISRENLDSVTKAHGVVFLGDAVHAMPIFGGEGGNHAILDGVELFRVIQSRGQGEIEAVIKEFYDRNTKRGQDAVRRCVQRFSGFHKSMPDWIKVGEMAKRRNT